MDDEHVLEPSTTSSTQQYLLKGKLHADERHLGKGKRKGDRSRHHSDDDPNPGSYRYKLLWLEGRVQSTGEGATEVSTTTQIAGRSGSTRGHTPHPYLKLIPHIHRVHASHLVCVVVYLFMGLLTHHGTESDGKEANSLGELHSQMENWYGWKRRTK